MKKILFLLIILFSMNSVIAIESDITPNWNNVAPNKYAKDLQYIENNTFANKHPMLNSLSTMTIVGIPFAIKSKRNSTNIEENNYWYNRKQEFESQINLCKQLTDQNAKINCFSTVRQNEQTQTAQKKQADLQEKLIKTNSFYYSQFLNNKNW
ncbi:hypothetical protein IJO12_07275 [bacterium]|nr:hypothetical protein [bacterium]